jgi:hypothetical protein
MKLTIITACSRPENLQKIKKSINIPCNWIIVYDSDKEIKNFDEPWIIETFTKGGIAGKKQLNHGLDYCDKDDWVYFLDDDNLLHPDFENVFKIMGWYYDRINHILHTSKYLGCIFAQELVDGMSRVPQKNIIKVCHVDQAQYLLHMSLIGEKRFIQQYEADGIFIEQIYKEHEDKIDIINEVLCYYNKLR